MIDNMLINSGVNIDPAYKIAKSMYIAIGGNPDMTFESADDIYDAINEIYASTGSRINVEELKLEITHNGGYTYDVDSITGYKPVEINVDVPQKYTDEQVEQIRQESYIEGSTDGYSDGYAEGLEDGATDQKALLESITISENGTYTKEDGYDEVIVDVPQKYTDEQVEQIRQESYYAGYNAGDDIGYNNGVEMGKTLQKSELIDITISESGTYEREDGYKKVVVDVVGPPTGGFDFSVIGYDKALENQINSEFMDKIDYSKSLYDKWDPNITRAYGYFELDKKLVYAPNINTSKVTNMSRMLYGCSNLTSIPQLDTSKVTTMSQMFTDCSNLTSIPQLDTSKVTIMTGMFSGCSNLTTVPQLDTSKVTDIGRMLYGCSSLTTIPQLDTSNVTHMNEMFRGCTSLTTIPQLDTSNVTSMTSMFDYCTSLTTIPQLDTSNVTSMSSMLNYCSSLTTIPQLDASKVTTINYFLTYGGSTNLTYFGGFLNLGMQSSLTGTNDNYGVGLCKNLTHESLMNIINNLYDRASAGYSVLTFKMHADNINKLTEDEIAIATNKGWTIA